jgi:hypothetical protein
MEFICPNKRIGYSRLVRACKAYKDSLTFTILMTSNSNSKIVKGSLPQIERDKIFKLG